MRICVLPNVKAQPPPKAVGWSDGLDLILRARPRLDLAACTQSRPFVVRLRNRHLIQGPSDPSAEWSDRKHHRKEDNESQ